MLHNDANVAALYTSDNFTVVSHCDEQHRRALAVTIVEHRPGQPAREAVLNHEILKGFCRRVDEWGHDVPTQGEVEEVLAGYALGGMAFCMH